MRGRKTTRSLPKCAMRRAPWTCALRRACRIGCSTGTISRRRIIAEERESRGEKRGPESKPRGGEQRRRRNTIETLGSRAKEVSTSPARVASATAAADHMKGRLAPAAATNWCADPAAALRPRPWTWAPIVGSKVLIGFMSLLSQSCFASHTGRNAMASSAFDSRMPKALSRSARSGRLRLPRAPQSRQSGVLLSDSRHESLPRRQSRTRSRSSSNPVLQASRTKCRRVTAGCTRSSGTAIGCMCASRTAA